MKPSQPPGDRLVVVMILAMISFSGAAVAERPVPPSQVFSTWQTLHFGDPDIPMAAPSADPDGDGLRNALECLLGSDPTRPSSSRGPALSATDEATFILTIDMANSYGMPLRLLGSSDLQQWNPMISRSAPGMWQIHLAGSTVSVDETTGRVSITIPRIGISSRFIRLEVDTGPVDASQDNADSDADGSADWLEIYAESVPAWKDSDGDGTSDQVELLTGRDPESSEYGEGQQEQAAFFTGLNVFTPVVNE